MAKLGRPKKPHALKVLSGTVQPCRIDPDDHEFQPLSEIPPPPDWLPNAHAVKEWHRLTEILFASHILTDASLSALAHLCALHGKIVQLYSAGENPNATLAGALRSMQNDFCLTPASQGRIKVTGEEKTGNAFASNGKKPAR